MQNGEQGDNDKAGGDCGRGGPAFAEATAGRPAFAWLPPPPKRFGVTSRRGQRGGRSGLKRALGTAGPTAAIRHPDSACLVLITQVRIAFKYGLSTGKCGKMRIFARAAVLDIWGVRSAHSEGARGAARQSRWQSEAPLAKAALPRTHSKTWRRFGGEPYARSVVDRGRPVPLWPGHSLGRPIGRILSHPPGNYCPVKGLIWGAEGVMIFASGMYGAATVTTEQVYFGGTCVAFGSCACGHRRLGLVYL